MNFQNCVLFSSKLVFAVLLCDPVHLQMMLTTGESVRVRRTSCPVQSMLYCAKRGNAETSSYHRLFPDQSILGLSKRWQHGKEALVFGSRVELSCSPCAGSAWYKPWAGRLRLMVFCQAPGLTWAASCHPSGLMYRVWSSAYGVLRMELVSVLIFNVVVGLGFVF